MLFDYSVRYLLPLNSLKNDFILNDYYFVTAAAVQVGHETRQAARNSHGHASSHYSIPMAIHKDAQASGQPGEGVH
jgi:hypothetical protein